MGHQFAQPDDGSLRVHSDHIGDDPFQIAKTGHPTHLYPPNKATLFDDFYGDTLDARWSGGSGSNSNAVDPTINAQVNGVVRMVSGSGGAGNDAVDASVLTAGLNWKANQGGLIFEARISLPSIASVNVCVGFTDVLATTTVEIPFEIGTSQAITSNCTDGAVWVFDTGASTDVFYGAGTKNGTDATLVTGIAPVASTFTKLRIVLDSSGNATYYQDGVNRGSQASAVTSSVALTPVCAVMSRTSAIKNLDVDYVFVQQDR